MVPHTPLYLPLLLLTLLIHIHPTTATNPSFVNIDDASNLNLYSLDSLDSSSPNPHHPHQLLLPYHQDDLDPPPSAPQYTLTLTIPLTAASSSISSTVTLTRPSTPHSTLPERIASGFTTVIGVNGTKTATVDAAAVGVVETGEVVSVGEKERWRMGRVEGEEDGGFGAVERGGAVGVRVVGKDKLEKTEENVDDSSGWIPSRHV
ncbi:hypothetical protein EX30DRAFT_351276 [Ascodesmis nigricans]|uniref:Uncharacterized protein n=1 Tax=Ascodesmis nigricans TaxID=341454 RepID=A0A4S2MM79_9PEZI|nr:hypothetical protein EX30DRAFT_351276 [Ascodesmis nigricans]